jgi:hypothetical protein
MQGTIKVVRSWLAQHTHAFLEAKIQIAGGFNRVGHDDFAVDGGLFNAERRTSLVKAGMAECKDKASTWRMPCINSSISAI